jgi:dynein heavy chain
MYNTALAQFIVLFELAMDRAEKAALPPKRIANIIEYLTYSVYLYISRGYFEAHKMLFPLLMCMKIQMQQGKLSSAHFDSFVKGGSALDIASVKKKPAN